MSSNATEKMLRKMLAPIKLSADNKEWLMENLRPLAEKRKGDPLYQCLRLCAQALEEGIRPHEVTAEELKAYISNYPTSQTFFAQATGLSTPAIYSYIGGHAVIPAYISLLMATARPITILTPEQKIQKFCAAFKEVVREGNYTPEELKNPAIFGGNPIAILPRGKTISFYLKETVARLPNSPILQQLISAAHLKGKTISRKLIKNDEGMIIGISFTRTV